MIIAHYDHRLPADYDLAIIRNRARRRGAIWDAVPELYFKAFLLRERGQFGATANNYSSLYLWRHDEAFGDFLKTGRYRTVTESFGRADIRTRFGLDARRGAAATAEFAVLDEKPIPLDADLNESLTAAIALNRAIAGEPDTVASIVGIDTQSWSLLQISLLHGKAQTDRRGTCYQIVHLAQPLLATLPWSEA